MSEQLQLRRDTAVNVSTFTPAQGECVVDTTNNRLCVGDGATLGGWPAARLNDGAVAFTGGTMNGVTIGGSSPEPISATAPAAGDSSSRAITSAWFGQNYPGGFRNVLRNAHFDIAQRGASGSVASGATGYTLDGWQIAATGAAAAWAQEYNANISGNALRISCASGLTACTLQQRIESYVAALLATPGKATQPITIQITIYNNSGGAITPKFATGYASAQDNFATVASDLSATNAQTIANGATGALAYTFSPASENLVDGYQVQLQFGGALNAASGYVDISLADIRVTPGVATGLNNSPPPQELRPIATELAFCQRYFATSYPYGTSPGSASSVGAVAVFALGLPSATYTGGDSITLGQPMRAAPTVVLYSISTGTSGKVRDYVNGVDVTGSTSNIGPSGFVWYATNASANTGYNFQAQWTAGAEL